MLNFGTYSSSLKCSVELKKVPGVLEVVEEGDDTAEGIGSKTRKIEPKRGLKMTWRNKEIIKDNCKRLAGNQ